MKLHIVVIATLLHMIVSERIAFDADSDSSIQIAQLKTLEKLIDAQSQQHDQTLRAIQTIGTNRYSLLDVLISSLLFSLTLWMIIEVWACLWYWLTIKSNRVFEFRYNLHNVKAKLQNREPFLTHDTYRKTISPPIMYTMCTCCKRSIEQVHEDVQA